MSQIPQLMSGRSLEHGIAMQVDHGGTSGSKMYVGGQAKAQTAISSFHTSDAENSVSQYIIPANSLVAGSTIRFHAAGTVVDNHSTATLTVRIRFGSSATAASNTEVFATAAVDVADNDIYCFEGLIQMRTVGATGTAAAMVSYQDPDATGTAPKWNLNSALSSVNTTGALYLDITGIFSGSANADNELRSDIFVVDIVNPST